MSRITFPGDPDFRPFGAAPTEGAGKPSGRLQLIRASDITPQAIRWIWPGWLAAGKLHILAGAPGTGKSTAAFALAATITIPDGRFPDGAQAERGEVAIWSGEDDPQDTIVPRLMASGADLERVHIVGAMETGAEPRPFDPSQDMPALRAALAEKDIRLLIVDPIVSAVAGDSHKNTETRRDLQPLVDLAAATNCALLGITHFTKGTAGRDPVERVTGSLAFGALARVVMVAAKLPEEDHGGARLLARAKSNIGPDCGGVHYHMEQVSIPGHPAITNTRVIWGKLVDGTARDLLATAEQPEGEDRTATREAREWLSELLAHGRMRAGDVKRDARQAGLGEKALRSAREQLGIKPAKMDFAGGWWWELPTEDAPKVPTQPERASSPLIQQQHIDNIIVLPRCPEGAQGGHLGEIEGVEGALGFLPKVPKMPSDFVRASSGHLGDSPAWATVDL